MTWSRLPIAAAVAIAWGLGWFELGAYLFALGLLTKAVDTPLSVAWKCPIPADDKPYRMVAVMFNATAVIGLTAAHGNMAYYGKMSWAMAALPLVTTAALMAITRLFVKPHSLIAKARSGLVSFIVIFFAAPDMPHYLVMVSLGLIWLGECYKVIYYTTKTPTQ